MISRLKSRNPTRRRSKRGLSEPSSSPDFTTSRKTTTEGAAEAAKILRSQQITTRREAAEAERKRPKFARPAVGGNVWWVEELNYDLNGLTSGSFELRNEDESPDAVLRIRSFAVTALPAGPR